VKLARLTWWEIIALGIGIGGSCAILSAAAHAVIF